jgi:hypothetical protein
MRTLAAAALLMLMFGASAPAQDAGNPTASKSTPGRRAPLANPDDLEPAVDVGAQRVALIDPPPPPGTNPAPAPDALPTPSTPAPTATKSEGKAPQSAPPSAAPNAAAADRAPNSRVLDTLDLGTTSITGNQELPKVLYIVPWKKSDLGDLVGRPVNTLLDEVLEPVDPEVFERHLSYYEALYGKGRKEKE